METAVPREERVTRRWWWWCIVQSSLCRLPRNQKSIWPVIFTTTLYLHPLCGVNQFLHWGFLPWYHQSCHILSRFTGFGVWGVWKSPFPIDLRHCPYNSVTLWCNLCLAYPLLSFHDWFKVSRYILDTFLFLLIVPYQYLGSEGCQVGR